MIEIKKVKVGDVYGYEIHKDSICVKDVSKLDTDEIYHALWGAGLRNSLIDIYCSGERIWWYWVKPNEDYDGYIESSYQERYEDNLKEILGGI